MNWKDSITQAPMTKKMLLNASQRKYLIERINRHARKLKTDSPPRLV
jgi:hypothetical protein